MAENVVHLYDNGDVHMMHTRVLTILITSGGGGGGT